MTGIGGFDNNTSKKILTQNSLARVVELETVYRRLRKTEVEAVAVIEFSCFDIKIRTNTTKLTKVKIARFRHCRDLIRKSEMFIEDKAEIASRVSGSNLRVMCIFVSCCLLPMRRNSGLEELKLRVIRLAVIHEEICSIIHGKICSSAFCRRVVVES